MGLHNASCRKLHSLDRLLPCADRRPNNLQRLAHHDTRISRRNGLHVALRNTNADNASTKSQEVDRLIIRALVSCAYNDSMGAVAARDSLHGLGDRFGAIYGDEMLSAAVEDKILLAGVVDAYYAVADSAGAVLDLPK